MSKEEISEIDETLAELVHIFKKTLTKQSEFSIESDKKLAAKLKDLEERVSKLEKNRR